MVRFCVETDSERGRRAPKDIKYAPERDIAVAISEYAPGRFITIDKKYIKVEVCILIQDREITNRIRLNTILTARIIKKTLLFVRNAIGLEGHRKHIQNVHTAMHVSNIAR